MTYKKFKEQLESLGFIKRNILGEKYAGKGEFVPTVVGFKYLNSFQMVSFNKDNGKTKIMYKAKSGKYKVVRESKDLDSLLSLIESDLLEYTNV